MPPKRRPPTLMDSWMREFFSRVAVLEQTSREAEKRQERMECAVLCLVDRIDDLENDFKHLSGLLDELKKVSKDLERLEKLLHDFDKLERDVVKLQWEVAEMEAHVYNHTGGRMDVR